MGLDAVHQGKFNFKVFSQFRKGQEVYSKDRLSLRSSGQADQKFSGDTRVPVGFSEKNQRGELNGLERRWIRQSHQERRQNPDRAEACALRYEFERNQRSLGWKIALQLDF